MNFKGIVLPSNYSKLAEVQFAIDRCKIMNNSKRDCDWLILACFIGEQSTFTRLEKKVWLENSADCVGKLLDSLS